MRVTSQVQIHPILLKQGLKCGLNVGGHSFWVFSVEVAGYLPRKKKGVKKNVAKMRAKDRLVSTQTIATDKYGNKVLRNIAKVRAKRRQDRRNVVRKCRKVSKRHALSSTQTMSTQTSALVKTDESNEIETHPHRPPKLTLT